MPTGPATTGDAGGKVDKDNPTQVGRALSASASSSRRVQPFPAGMSASSTTRCLRCNLCIHEDRTVANDNTVRYKRLALQIPADRHRRHYVKATVRVHEYPDGTLAVFHGPRCLARYKAGGEPIDTSTRQAA